MAHADIKSSKILHNLSLHQYERHRKLLLSKDIGKQDNNSSAYNLISALCADNYVICWKNGAILKKVFIAKKTIWKMKR